jgi:hypothetical protein
VAQIVENTLIVAIMELTDLCVQLVHGLGRRCASGACGIHGARATLTGLEGPDFALFLRQLCGEMSAVALNAAVQIL